MSSKRLYSGNSISVSESSGDSVDRVKLPQPDLKNITALTRNLPNSPILPWNHYDSPQQTEASDEANEPND